MESQRKWRSKGIRNFLLLVAVAGVAGPSFPPYRRAGTGEMAKRLEEIARKTSAWDNPRMNAEMMRYFHQRIARAKDLRSEALSRMTLAYSLLLDGKAQQAVQEFQRVERLVARREVPSEFSQQRRDQLAIAYLRLGEQENCIARHNPDSCYLPMREGGVYSIERGPREAVKFLVETLDERPGDLSSRWLLNIAHMTLGEYPEKVPPKWLIPPQTFESDYDIKRFEDVAPSLGLDAVGLAGGSIVEDFDGDGYLDIMVSSWPLSDQILFFRNQGDGTFVDRTREVGLLGEVGGWNIIHADYNNDGYPDVFILRGAWLHERGLHPNSLLLNHRDGTFEDVTEKAGLLGFHPSHTAAWGDFDNDGWVDLFVVNESDNREVHPCQLFRNNGDGTFSEQAASAGVSVVGFVKGVAWGDYDNDGRLDLYISRWQQPNLLYRNEGRNPTTGKWTFRDVSEQAGVTEPLDSFATWFWDYNNDGWLDLFVAGFHLNEPAWEGNPAGGGNLEDVVAVYLDLPGAKQAGSLRLFRNNQDGTFGNVTREVGLDGLRLIMGCNFGDLDNDGFLDLYAGTGEPDLRTLIPNRMFRNAGGKYFQDVTTSGGFGHLQKGHGVSFADIDNDGDQDVYTVMGGHYSGDVYQNVLFENPGHGNHWITLKLEGVQSNRLALGARIKVAVKTKTGSREIHRVVSSGGSFGSSSLQQEIGLGQATSILAIEVIWPASGQVQILKNVAMDRVVQIREGVPDPIPLPLNRFSFSRDPAHANHPGSSPQHRIQLPSPEEVIRKIADGRYGEAAQDLKQLVAATGSTELYHYLGFCQLRLREYAEAIESFRKATSDEADAWRAQAGIGMAYFYLNRVDEAREIFEGLLSQQPQDMTSLLFLGKVSLSQKRYDEAEKTFRKILDQAVHLEALFDLGRCLRLQGRTAEAEKVLQQHQNLAHPLNRLKILKEVAAGPYATKRIVSDLADTYLKLANAYLEGGAHQNVIATLEEFRAVQPHGDEPSLILGKLSLQQGDYLGAEIHLRQYLKSDPEGFLAWQLLGQAYQGQRNHTKALEAFEKAGKIDPENPELQTLRKRSRVEVE